MDKLIIKVDAKYIYDKLTKLGSTADSILEHTQLTNGRVSKLEECNKQDIVPRIDKLEKMHIKQAGFVAGAVGVVQVVLFLFFK